MTEIKIDRYKLINVVEKMSLDNKFIRIQIGTMKFKLNSKMLIETLKPMVEKFCRIQIQDPTQPVAFTENSDDMFVSMICPIQS